LLSLTITSFQTYGQRFLWVLLKEFFNSLLGPVKAESRPNQGCFIKRGPKLTVKRGPGEGEFFRQKGLTGGKVKL
jgi:hypothetical protein